MKLRAESLESNRQRWQIPTQPDIALERWVTVAESSSVWVACLNEAGYPVTLQGTDGISFSDVPPEQNTKGGSLFVALYECEARYSLDPRADMPLAADQVAVLYSYLSGQLAACLRDHGFEIAAAPSSQAFAESFARHEQWTPYDDVPLATLSATETDDLFGDCPQAPSDDQLYGPLPSP
jgi:hypothetical protein